MRPKEPDPKARSLAPRQQRVGQLFLGDRAVEAGPRIALVGLGGAPGGLAGTQLNQRGSTSAAGSIPVDCNANGVHDLVDIANGDSLDLNLDNIPDECQCPADLDGDGDLTLFDFLSFQNLFDAGDPAADFDGDGSLTLFDFLAFQNAFDAGC
ncbi:MAG: GC-type dockerin domain-anchored protein [Phycisphaerales bacterium]